MKNYLYTIWKPAIVNSLWPVFVFVAFILAPMAVFALLDYPLLNWVIEHNWAAGCMLWIVFAFTDATMHKYLIEDAIAQNIKLTIDGHVFANIYRFFVWLGLLAFVGMASAVSIGITFPFFQSGLLYYLRGQAGVEQYKSGWWSNPSATSSAKSNKYLKWWMRLLYAAIGITALFYFNRTNLW